MINIKTIAEKTIEELLSENDFWGAATKAYTDSMGEYVFYSLFILAIAGALVIRYQSYYPVIILALILFGIFQTLIPAPIMGVILGLLSLLGGGIIFRLFVRDRDY